MRLLKLEKDDPQKELEFEVKCALEIPPSDRLDHWLDWNLQMLQFIEQQNRLTTSGYEDTASVIKRP